MVRSKRKFFVITKTKIKKKKKTHKLKKKKNIIKYSSKAILERINNIPTYHDDSPIYEDNFTSEENNIISDSQIIQQIILETFIHQNTYFIPIKQN